MLKWGDLFTARQKLALVTLAKTIQNASCDTAVKDLLGLVVDRVASRSSSLCLWRYHADQEKVEHIFGRQALPVVWDFAEAVVMSESTGSFQDGIDVVAQCVQSIAAKFEAAGQVQLADARISVLPDEIANVWFTDPPYYDAVPYADLSDFFFVWLKRTLPDHPLLHDPFDPNNPSTPKTHEVVQDEVKEVDGRPKDHLFFEEAMARAFGGGRRVLKDDGIGCVVFAHKTTEGWEALLSGMINAGWVITGSWPITTEMANRLRARESAALSASVHLVCRPRTSDEIGDWGEVLQELPKRVVDWMERLQSEHIRGADLVFACIGPALEIYSRYSKVVDAEDREIPLGGDPEATEPHNRGYLAYVWEAVGRAALEQVLGTTEATARNGAAGALEEDARLTALFLWTLQSTNGEDKEKGKSKKEKGEYEAREEESEEDEDDEEETSTKGKKKKGLTLVFDVVRRFAQPLGIHLDNWEDRIIETEKGIVRLLPVAERGTQLFGQDGADLVAERLEREPMGAIQMALFPERTEAPQVKSKKGKGKKARLPGGGQGTAKELRTNTEATTLDRLHAAMLLQASGRTNALRAMLKAEQDRGPDFLRLANALSALYPRDSEEKRLLDAMLLAVPR
jgi:adenine-specific DNA methylase